MSELENITSSKDLSLKTMTFDIETLNNLFRKNGYMLATVYTREKAMILGASKGSLFYARVENSEHISDTISKVLKIDVQSVCWHTNDTLKIEYLEK